MAILPSIPCPACGGAEVVKIPIEIVEPCACSDKPIEREPVSDEEAARRYREMSETLTRAQRRGTELLTRARDAEGKVGEATERLTALAREMKTNSIGYGAIETAIARVVLMLETGELPAS